MVRHAISHARFQRAAELAASWTPVIDEADFRRALPRLIEVVPYDECVLEVADGEATNVFTSNAGEPFERSDRACLDPEVQRLLEGNTPRPRTSNHGRSILRAPLRHDGCRVTGCLVLCSELQYSKADRKLVGVLARCVVGTLERVRRIAKVVDESQTKDAFLSVLGHDMRSPLSAVSSLVSLMRLGHCDAATLEMIDHQIAYLTRMAEDIGEVARITGGRVSLDLAPVALDTVLRNGIECARLELEEREQRIVLDSAVRLTVLGDEARLSYVIAKLLCSWSKRVPWGSTLTIATRRREERAEIHVYSDQRPAPPVLANAASSAADVEPHDLGFRIAADTIALHGGTLAVRKTDAGLEAVVSLPRTRLAPSAPSPSLAQIARAHRQRVPACRVLVVDDNRDVARSVGRVLAELGHTVEVTFDGETALACANALEPNVMFINIGLPGTDGCDVARTLRASNGAAAGARLVAMTGFASKVERERALAAGFDAHLPKPVDLVSLAGVLERLSWQDPPA